CIPRPLLFLIPKFISVCLFVILPLCLTKWPFFFTSWSLSMQRVVCELQAQTDYIIFF
uniref:Uncharacterized protein n=1 Tax=Poecilia latipinna TaxID=48699 RepID=A0A3B3U956_9TELE